MEILCETAAVDFKWVKDSPDLIKDKIKGLSYFFRIRKCDCINLAPEWFKKEIAGVYDLTSIIESLQRRPPVWIRVQNNAQESVLKELGVLVDAPCSGTGMWRRNPDLRWTASEDICEQSACVQKEILELACRKVKA